MTTQINSYISASTDGSRSNVKSVDSSKPASGAGAAVSNVARIDSVKLTPDAVQLQQLESSIAQIPVADHQRVDKVRQAIADGTYQVDAQKIAAKLARMEWDLAKP